MMADAKFKAGDIVYKISGRYGGPGRIIGVPLDMADNYILYNVAMRVDSGFGEFVHIFRESDLMLMSDINMGTHGQQNWST